MKIAVIGTGVSGMVCSWLLQREHNITVYETDSRIGGHSNTCDIEFTENGEVKSYPVDTGFIVFNYKTYPLFTQLMTHLGVENIASTMSFAVRDEVSKIEYLGSDNIPAIFAQKRNLIRPRFWGMLKDIKRFYEDAQKLLDHGDDSMPGEELGRWLQSREYSKTFIDSHLIPMGAAIWSAPPEQMLRFPVRYFCRFLANHGMILLNDRPQWRTIKGGSRVYVDKLIASFKDRVRLNAGVESITRENNNVIVKAKDGSIELYDRVVIAAHADQALSMLDDATPLEQELRAFAYQANEAVLHTDYQHTLPQRKQAWGAWNYYRGHKRDNEPATLTYNLSMLQSLDTPEPVLVSLNAHELIREEKITKRIQYQHPLYSREAVLTQQRFQEISGSHLVHFCGAYWGYGFHEDGVRSAWNVAQQFGIDEFIPGEYFQSTSSASHNLVKPALSKVG